MAKLSGIFSAVGVQKYEHHRALSAVPADLGTMAELTARLGFAEQRILGDTGRSPTAEEISNWFRGVVSEAAQKQRPLFLYWSGHGEVEGGAHFLLGSDSPSHGFENGRAYPAAELGRLLASASISRGLVIVDSCYAGTGVTDLAAAINDGLRSRTAEAADADSGIVIIAASRPAETALDGDFASALRAVLRDDPRVGSFSDKYVQIGGLIAALNDHLSAGAGFRAVSSNVVDLTAPIELLLNPRWGKGPVCQAPDRKWLEQTANGLDNPHEPGCFFSGRQRVMDEIVNWAQRGAPKLLIVTGPPGSGKSAIVGRSLSACEVRAALRVWGKTPDEVIATLASLLGIELPRAAAGEHSGAATRMREFLSELSDMAAIEPMLLVIDGLDEAAPGQAVVVARALAKISAVRNVRLIIGTRPGHRGDAKATLLEALDAAAATVIDLSAPEWESDVSLELYVRARLLAAWLGTRLEAKAATLAEEAASAVARDLKGQFHVARFVVRHLARSVNPVLSQLSFATDIDAAIRTDLNERFASNATIEEFLRALAWAAGDGFPEDVWLSTARALPSNRELGAAGLMLAIEAAGDYLEAVDGAPGGKARWRLYHVTYVDYFQALTREDLRCTSAEVEARIVSALKPARWDQANHYALTDLAGHAVRAGLLSSLMEDFEYLKRAQPRALLRSFLGLSAQAPEHTSVRRYKRVAHHFLDSGIGERAAYLKLAAAEDGAPQSVASGDGDQPWAIRWLSVSFVGLQPSRAIPLSNPGYAVSVTSFRGRAVAVIGGATVSIVDLFHGTTLFEVQRAGNAPEVTCQARILTDPQRPQVISLVEVQRNPEDESGVADHSRIELLRCFQVWDLATNTRSDHFHSKTDDIIARYPGVLAVGEGLVVIARLDAGAPSCAATGAGPALPPLEPLDSVVSCVAVARVRDERIIVCGTMSGEVAVYSLASGKCRRALAATGPEAICAISTLSDESGLLIVSGSAGGATVWRLEEDLRPTAISRQAGAIDAVTCAGSQGRRYIATLTRGRATLWLLDAQGHFEKICPLYSGAHQLNDVCFGLDDDEQLILTAVDGVAGRPHAFSLSGFVRSPTATGRLLIWEASEFSRLDAPPPPQVRAIRVLAPQAKESSHSDVVLALWGGEDSKNYLAIMDAKSGKGGETYDQLAPAGSEWSSSKITACDAVQLPSGDICAAFGFASGLLAIFHRADQSMLFTELRSRSIVSMALAASEHGATHLLAVDSTSDLHYLKWTDLREGLIEIGPEAANAFYQGRRAMQGVRINGEKFEVTGEVLPFARVVFGAARGELAHKPCFVICGDAGCNFCVLHDSGRSISEFPLDFPVHGAQLTEGYLAVRSPREVLLFRVGDDPAQVTGVVIELAQDGRSLQQPSNRITPIWARAWHAPITAISLRRGAHGLRLVVGTLGGNVSVHSVVPDGVRDVWQLDLDSPVTDVVALGDGGTLVAAWSGLRCFD